MCLFGELQIAPLDLLFTSHELLRHLIDLLTLAVGPLLEVVFLLQETFVLLREFLADGLQLFLLVRDVLLQEALVVSQARTDLAQALGQRGGRRRAGELHPQLLAGQAHFQGLAMELAQFFAELLEGGAALIDVLAAAAHGLPLLLQVADRSAVLEGQLPALGVERLLHLTLLLLQFLAQFFHFFLGDGQALLTLVESLPACSEIGLGLKLVVLASDLIGGGGPARLAQIFGCGLGLGFEGLAVLFDARHGQSHLFLHRGLLGLDLLAAILQGVFGAAAFDFPRLARAAQLGVLFGQSRLP